MRTSPAPNLPARQRELRPLTWWAGHFKRDLQRDWTIAWTSNVTLSDRERARIAASIAEFQRGESSEALSYLKKSASFAAGENDSTFHATSRLFVATENLHADLLLRFMQLTGIPRRQSCSRDRIFRWLRGLGDLGWSSRVIIVAELIAQEYYPCLRAATLHPVLTRICDRIVAEEAAHIRFQVERIARVEARHAPLVTRLRDVLQSLLMWGTAAAVYVGHRQVLNVRLSLGEFLVRAHARNRRAIAATNRLRQSVVSRAQRNSTQSARRLAL
jgi:hypothetical protein